MPPGKALEYNNSNSALYSSKNIDGSSSHTIDIFAVMYDAISGDARAMRRIDSWRDDELIKMEIHPNKDMVYPTANAWDFASAG